MNKIRIDIQRCKGCLYCAIACPGKSIRNSEEINEKGYNFAIVDLEKCNGCLSCIIICPDNAIEAAKE